MKNILFEFRIKSLYRYENLQLEEIFLGEIRALSTHTKTDPIQPKTSLTFYLIVVPIQQPIGFFDIISKCHI